MSGRVPGGHGCVVVLPGAATGPGLTVVGDCVPGVPGVVLDDVEGEGVLAPLPPLLPGVLPGRLPADVDGDRFDGVVEDCPAAVLDPDDVPGVAGVDDDAGGDEGDVDVVGSVCGVRPVGPVGSSGVVDVTGTHGANGALVGCCGGVDGNEPGVDGLCVDGLGVGGLCVEGLCVVGLLGVDDEGADAPLF